MPRSLTLTVDHHKAALSFLSIFRRSSENISEGGVIGLLELPAYLAGRIGGR
jgi:hypothetical protein